MLRFTVASSSSDREYEIVAERVSDGFLRLSCQCDAAENGSHCKHRLNLLTGTPKEQKLTSGNSDDVALLRQWLVGTQLEEAIFSVKEITRDFEVAKLRLSKAKKALGSTLATGKLPT